MKDQDELKRDLEALARRLWADDALALSDSARARRLRPEILQRLLALVMTDDERATFLGLPAGCRVRESAKILSPEKLSCGEYVWIGEGAMVDASGGLTIGAHTTIATGVYVWTHSSTLSNLMHDNASGNAWIRRQSTAIGSGCFLGGPSVVYPGVTIGDQSVVLPMSVVTADVPARTMVGGAPARVIRAIDDEYLRQLAADVRPGGQPS